MTASPEDPDSLPILDGLPALAYAVVDVFTDQAYAGNPLAVVLGGEDLSTESMQAIAQEFNLSETTFPLPPSDASADYRLRIFTPGAELPFAGHPSVGSAWLLRSLGRLGDGEVVQECGAGLLPLVIDGDRVTLTGGTPTIGAVLDESEVLAALRLEASDLAGDPIRCAGVGLEFGFAHVRPDAVARCRPDFGAIDQICGSATGLSVFSFVDGVAHARVYADDVGEDPATGSAALGLGVWLADRGLVDGDGESSYLVEQGIEMGRPSRLECVVRCESGRAVEVRVTGSVVPIATGRIRVP